MATLKHPTQDRVQIEFDRGEGWFSANVETGAGGTILDDNDEPIMQTGRRGYARAKAAYLRRWPDAVIVEEFDGPSSRPCRDCNGSGYVGTVDADCGSCGGCGSVPGEPSY